MTFLSRQQKNLVKFFESAKSVEEKLKWFKKVESCFQESDLGVPCYTLAKMLFESGEKDLEQVLCFGKRCLRIFLTNNDNNVRCSGILSSDFGYFKNGSYCCCYHGSAFYIALVCKLLGSASFELNRLGECLSYFNWANRNLSSLLRLDETSCCSGNCVLLTLRTVQKCLLCFKKAVGNKDEVVGHALKILEIDEKTMEEGCIKLGETYKMVSEAYVDYTSDSEEEALPFALKALDIYTKHDVGDDSAELAQVRRYLGTIYGGLGEHDKALELLRSSLKGLKSMECTSLWLFAETQVANTLLQLGRDEEGIEVFKSLLPLAESEGDHYIRGCSFIGISRGFVNIGKFSDARKYMKIAQRAFTEKQMNARLVAIFFVDMSRIYEEMQDNESASFYSRKALAIPELPQNFLKESSSRLFLLSLKNRKEKKGFSYLEEVVDRLKEKLGPEHILVSFGFNTLGVSYMRSGQLEKAAESFVLAKDVLDVSLGLHHLASMKARQCLAMTHANEERIREAIIIQEIVVESIKGLKLTEKGCLDEAVKLLNIMKEIVAESPTSVSPQSKGCEDLSAKISKCEISD